MKKMKFTSHGLLPLVLALFLGGCIVARTFIPMVILPKLNIPNMVLLSLIALLLRHYFAGGTGSWDLLAPVIALLSFGLLPYVSGFAAGLQVLKLAVVGAVVYSLISWLFCEMMERLSSGPVAKAAPAFSALGLYLASQCFAGIIL